MPYSSRPSLPQVHSLRRSGDAYVSQTLTGLQGVRLVAHPGMSPVDGSIFVAMSGGESCFLFEFASFLKMSPVAGSVFVAMPGGESCFCLQISLRFLKCPLLLAPFLWQCQEVRAAFVSKFRFVS